MMVEDADTPGPPPDTRPEGEVENPPLEQLAEELTWRQELLSRARETARRIQERVRKVLGGGMAARPPDRPPGES